jgi:hypothetical protein
LAEGVNVETLLFDSIVLEHSSKKDFFGQKGSNPLIGTEES